jgi:hypothetical protein
MSDEHGIAQGLDVGLAGEGEESCEDGCGEESVGSVHSIEMLENWFGCWSKWSRRTRS